MAVSQLTLRELLKDPLYRKWFGKVPELKKMLRTRPPWRVYIQEEFKGKWSDTRFEKYSQAYNYVRANLKDVHDMTINCPSQGFKQPVVKQGGVKKLYVPPAVQLADEDTVNDTHNHIWCPFCRRWTLFLYYKFHHSLPRTWGTLAAERRCKICGIRLIYVLGGKR